MLAPLKIPSSPAHSLVNSLFPSPGSRAANVLPPIPPEPAFPMQPTPSKLPRRLTTSPPISPGSPEYARLPPPRRNKRLYLVISIFTPFVPPSRSPATCSVVTAFHASSRALRRHAHICLTPYRVSRDTPISLLTAPPRPASSSDCFDNSLYTL